MDMDMDTDLDMDMDSDTAGSMVRSLWLYLLFLYIGGVL